jgi:hypothetical protein
VTPQQQPIEAVPIKAIPYLIAYIDHQKARLHQCSDPERVELAPERSWSRSSEARAGGSLHDQGRDYDRGQRFAQWRGGAGHRACRDNKTILVQFNVEKALAAYQIRDNRLVDTGERLKLVAGPVSIPVMPQ